MHELWKELLSLYVNMDERKKLNKKRWDPRWSKIEMARKNSRKPSGQGVECCQHPADSFSSSFNSQQKRALVLSYWSSSQPIRRQTHCFVISFWLRKAQFSCSVCGSLIKCQVSAASGENPTSLWCDRSRFILINTIRWLQEWKGRLSSAWHSSFGGLSVGKGIAREPC